MSSITKKAVPGNSDLKFHPLADIFPLMEGEEFDALVADIKANGLIEPIVMLDGMILDGRNRYRACVAADVEPTFRPFTGDDPAAYVISANIHRRHLTAEQKRELIAKLIKAQPEKSDRQIAGAAKASPTTVGTVRAKMEAAGDVSKLDTRTDSRGREQPANRVKPVAEALNKAPRRTRLERELDAGAFDRLRVEQQRNSDLAEKLRAAEMKIAGLESEVADLKAERDRLRAEVAARQDALQVTTAVSAIKTEKLLEGKPKVQHAAPDGLDIPECLRRDQVSR
jgi:ParB-like chromosome segregation protein Spo0J